MPNINPTTKEELQKRLRRIEGQLRGVQNMLAEDRDCQEVVQQLTSIRSAIQGASLYLVQENIASCLLDLDVAEPREREKKVEGLIKIIGKVT
jgi:DNA-binding FrmR family transcriptional regulator